MFRPYISVETSASLFFSFKIYPETARKQKRRLGVNLSHEFSQNLFLETAPLQFITETPLSGPVDEADMS